MFKLFVSLALVAAASAVLYNNNEYLTVNRDGSYLQINSQNGLRVAIVKNRYAGQRGLKNFDFTLSGNNFYKNFRYENQVGGDVVFDLLARYQGEVDAVTFQHILTRIQEFVQQGEVHPKIFYMLLALQNQQYTQYLTNSYGVQGLFGPGYYQRTYGNQGFYGNQRYYGNQGLYGNQGFYGKQGFYGHQGIYGNQGLFGHQGLYTGNYYGNQGRFFGNQGLYGQGYYNRYGYGPFNAQSSIWNQILYRQQPYYGGFYNHQGYNGVNQIANQVARQVENQIGNEVEQEVEQQVGHKLGFYGQGLNQYQYGRQGLFGNYFNQFQGGFYGQTPYHYNNFYNVLRGINRYPITAY